MQKPPSAHRIDRIGGGTPVAQASANRNYAGDDTTATTSADHKKLAAHYRAHAAEHEADAKLHEEIVAIARKQDQTSGHAWELARGAAHYAEHSREAAEALTDLAALHDGMAETAAGAKKPH